MGFDFYQIYVRTLRSYGGMRLDKLIARMNASQDETHRQIHEAHIRGITEWDKQSKDTNVFARLSAYKLDEELKRAAPTQWVASWTLLWSSETNSRDYSTKAARRVVTRPPPRRSMTNSRTIQGARLMSCLTGS